MYCCVLMGDVMDGVGNDEVMGNVVGVVCWCDVCVGVGVGGDVCGGWYGYVCVCCWDWCG